jgi:hypothetical protein
MRNSFPEARDQSELRYCRRGSLAAFEFGPGPSHTLPPRKNSSLGAKLFKEKRLLYAKSPLHHVREIAKPKHWNESAIQKREARIIAWAKSEFGT